jgi:quinol monooxygenase YgiN
MDVEVAIMAVKDGNAAGMIKAMNDGGSAALLSCPGCHSVKVYPGIENPGSVLFLIEWDSVDAHNAAKGTDGFGRFVKAITPFFGEGGGSMQHFKVS